MLNKYKFRLMWSMCTEDVFVTRYNHLVPALVLRKFLRSDYITRFEAPYRMVFVDE